MSSVRVNFSYPQLDFLVMNQNFVVYAADFQDFGSEKLVGNIIPSTPTAQKDRPERIGR